jgi:hypothetical protein
VSSTAQSGRRRHGTLTRLSVGFVLVGGMLAVPVINMWPDSSAPAPTQTAVAAVTLDRADAENQYATLADEDRRLLTLVGSVRPGSRPYVQTVDGVDTLVLTEGGQTYRARDLVRLGAAEVQENWDVVLTEHVLVAPGARLVVDAPGATLRLSSDESGFVSLVAWKADLVLRGTESSPLRISSWDTEEGSPDPEPTDGRAYIRDVSGTMQLKHVDTSHLGFWAGRTGGVAWTGSSSTSATGSVVGSSFRSNYYGAFASQADGLTISESSFSANIVDGLSLHRSTVDTTVVSSSAHDNGRHGFSADQGSENVRFEDVRSVGNTSHGIAFSGAPLSEGQSAGGASVRTYGGLEVVGGELRDNEGAGLRIVEADDVVVTDTRGSGNATGISLADTAASTRIEGAVVTGAEDVGISVKGGAATVTGNEVSGSGTGIRVRDAEAEVSGNEITRASDHAISVIGTASGSVVVDNTISGRGPSGLDVYRLAEGAAVEQSGNDVEGWQRDRDNWEYWRTFIPKHPMLLLWVLVLGVPLAIALRMRAHPAPAATPPYRETQRRERPAPLRVDVGRRMASGDPA